MAEETARERRARKEREEAEFEPVARWFAEHVQENDRPYKLDLTQARAVVNKSKNLLVAARAGTGKTRILVAKIIWLIARDGMRPEEITAFVFNNEARREINERLKRIRVDGETIEAEVATTFHAYARGLVYEIAGENHGEILTDSKERGGPVRQQFIQTIVEELPKQKIYRHFREEMLEPARGHYTSERDFYEALRGAAYETLDGKLVKTQAEKVICDFLFEHGVAYYYENQYYMASARRLAKPEALRRLGERESIKPDFYLPEYNLVWEHWAITGQEGRAEVAEINARGGIGNYKAYQQNMEWKRWFYGKSWMRERAPAEMTKYEQQIWEMTGLVETTASLVPREELEKQLGETLRVWGVRLKKLPEEELVALAWRRQVKKFTRMIVQFIDRAEQEYLAEPELLRRKIGCVENEWVRTFLEIGEACYGKYLQQLRAAERYGIDFAQLMARAAAVVAEGKADRVVAGKTRQILVDEYQDFSKLFLDLVQAVRRKNPEAALLCVGDELQAINRFTGADTKYFRNFTEYFPEDAEILQVTTNYRSAKNIVANARKFAMKALGEGGSFQAAREDLGELYLCDTSEVWLESRRGAEHTRELREDETYKRAMALGDGRNPDKSAVQLLKLMTRIIMDNSEAERILILHRNNDLSLYMVNLRELEKRLRTVLAQKKIMRPEEFRRKVQFATMHRAKGLEANVVILLEIDAGIMPMSHPDTALYGIFGETAGIALEDQKKLFYMALTRAKEKLYVCHRTPRPGEARKVSGFIESLEGHPRLMKFIWQK
jgi:DNA helicase-4